MEDRQEGVLRKAGASSYCSSVIPNLQHKIVYIKKKGRREGRKKGTKISRLQQQMSYSNTKQLSVHWLFYNKKKKSKNTKHELSVKITMKVQSTLRYN